MMTFSTRYTLGPYTCDSTVSQLNALNAFINKDMTVAHQ